MNEIQPAGFWKCTVVCGAGCLACIADSVIIVVDTITGATAMASGSAQ